MDGDIKKLNLWQALTLFFVPIAIILYGIIIKHIAPPAVPLFLAVFTAALLAKLMGIPWNVLQKGMFDALSRSQIALHIIILVGAMIGIWLHCGTIGMVLYWGLKIISAEWFLVTSFISTAIAAIMTGTSFGCIGTVGVAFYGIGTALGYSDGMILGPIISGAMLGDKMSPVSDTTNIAASNCETDLFDHIGSMMYTTVPASIVACILFAVIAHPIQSGSEAFTEVNTILATLEQHSNLSVITLLPPVVLFTLAWKRFPVIPTLVLSILAGVLVALIDGESADSLIKTATSGYVSDTGVKSVDSLLSRGGMLSVLPTLLLFIPSLSFGGILEASGVFATLISHILKWTQNLVMLIFSTLFMAFCILIGTGNMMVASIITGRAFADTYKKRNIHAKVLSRTCEDSATVLSMLIPWSVPAFFVMGVLGVSAWDYMYYSYFNIFCPIFAIINGATKFGIWDLSGKPLWKKSKNN